MEETRGGADGARRHKSAGRRWAQGCVRRQRRGGSRDRRGAPVAQRADGEGHAAQRRGLAAAQPVAKVSGLGGGHAVALAGPVCGACEPCSGKERAQRTAPSQTAVKTDNSKRKQCSGLRSAAPTCVEQTTSSACCWPRLANPCGCSAMSTSCGQYPASFSCSPAFSAT